MTPDGQIHYHSQGITARSYPYDITTGPDGNIWFTENGGNRIGKLNPATDTITEDTISSRAGGITAGPGGTVWFTDGNGIGRIFPAGPFTPTDQIYEFAYGN